MRKIVKNKKGAEMTIGTIVIIVLALIVLVVLIVGFTGGWSNLWERISSFFGGGNNIDTTVQACQTACATKSTYDFCTRQRTIKSDTAMFMVGVDGKITGVGGTEKKGTATCQELSKDTYRTLGVQKCDDVDCVPEPDKVCKGTETVCDGLTEQQCGTATTGQLGCTYKAATETEPAKCDGTATVCTGLTKQQCGTATTGQLGCSWE